MKNYSLLFILFLLSILINAQDVAYQLEKDIPYYPETINKTDDYINERCKLDIYYPTHLKDFPVVVWFHEGGLMYGQKEIPAQLKEKEIAIVGVNYRLNPKVQCPAYIEDAAAAVTWVFKNISEFGGDTSLIFVSGHSAGGYLTNMVGLDKRWLGKYNIDANRIAGLIPFSGNAITHITVRKERGIEPTQPLIDEFAPLYHVRADAPPLLLISGDRNLELYGRYEENAYFMRMMKVVGHTHTRILELDGYGHLMTEPAFPLLITEINRIIDE